MLGIKEIIVSIYPMELGNKNTNRENNTTTKHLETRTKADKCFVYYKEQLKEIDFENTNLYISRIYELRSSRIFC